MAKQSEMGSKPILILDERRLKMGIKEEFLDKLKLHNEYINSGFKLGQLLEIEGLDLKGIDLPNRNLDSAVLFGVNFDISNLMGVDM